MEATRRSLFLFLMLCSGFHRSSTEILKRQKRDWIIDSFRIKEGYKGSYPYDLGKIEIAKNFTFFEIHGQGVNDDPKGILTIDRDSGMIRVHGPVDYEKYPVLKLAFQALNRHSELVDTRLGVEIWIDDANDNPPKFDSEYYEISIKEATSQGTVLTTLKATDVDSIKENKLFDFKVVSVTPKQVGMEFYLQQSGSIATISFRGCLDYEKAEKYTIIVEAKDRGKDIQLSSSCTVVINIEDGNNHLPKITGQTGPGRVEEGKENELVSRIQVTDLDSRGSAAWRAKYKIHGDTENHFNITTDPITNEGLLFVKKHLDHEESQMKNLTISVENEIPYSSCQVVSRSSTGLWQVVTVSGASAAGSQQYSSRKVTVIVDDVNESPAFKIISKRVNVAENCGLGTYLTTLTAKDPDTAKTSKVEYKIGDDPAGWITVDSKTGKISTKMNIDRESTFIKNNIYNVTIYAVDNGKPPMTGTTTLNIHVGDDNDNAPSLPVTVIDMCSSDGLSLAKITASDPDEEPYGGPFTYKLQNEDKGKWRIDPNHGFSVDLLKAPIVHSGSYELMLEVSDLQGNKAVHNLSVTVCKCEDPTKPNCRIRKAKGSSIGAGGIGIIFFGLLLLAGLLLLVFLLSCKKQDIKIPDGESGQHLMSSNIEKQGTDCKVAYESFNKGHIQNEERIQTMSKATNMKKSFSNSAAAAAVGAAAAVSKGESHYVTSGTQFQQKQRDYVDWMAAESKMERNMALGNSFRQMAAESTMERNMALGNSMRQSMGASSTMRTRNQQRSFNHGTWGGNSRFTSGRRRFLSDQDAYDADAVDADIQRATLLKVLNKMMYRLQTPGEELGDYPPHVYAEEGGTRTNLQLDAISIPEVSFDPHSDLDLDNKFTTLASICMQDKSSAHTTITSTQTVSNTVSHSDFHGKLKMNTPSQFQF